MHPFFGRCIGNESEYRIFLNNDIVDYYSMERGKGKIGRREESWRNRFWDSEFERSKIFLLL